MKLNFQKTDLHKALQAIQKVASNKSNNLYVQNGFLIKAFNDVIEFQANDYDMGIKTIVPGIIVEPGEVFICNPYLIELIRRLPSAEIEMVKDEAATQLTVRGGKLKFECLTMNTEDFTEIDIVESGSSNMHIDSITLKDLIENTAYACSQDEARPIFTGTCIDVKGDTVNMVATDTHRLALKVATLEQPVDTPFKAIIPSRLLGEISRLLPVDYKEDVEIMVVRTFMAMRFGNIYIRTRLLEGEFPNYHRVIPKEFSSIATVSRQDFTAAVERASIIAKESSYNIINFTFADDMIHLTSQNADYGTIEDAIPCKIDGDAIHISFNSNFLIDILKHCHDDEIFLKAKENSPMLVKDTKEEHCVCVVTPMRSK